MISLLISPSSSSSSSTLTSPTTLYCCWFPLLVKQLVLSPSMTPSTHYCMSLVPAPYSLTQHTQSPCLWIFVVCWGNSWVPLRTKDWVQSGYSWHHLSSIPHSLSPCIHSTTSKIDLSSLTGPCLVHCAEWGALGKSVGRQRSCAGHSSPPRI